MQLINELNAIGLGWKAPLSMIMSILLTIPLGIEAIFFMSIAMLNLFILIVTWHSGVLFESGIDYFIAISIPFCLLCVGIEVSKKFSSY